MANTESTFDAAKRHTRDMARDAKETIASAATDEAETLRQSAIDEVDQAADATDAARQEFDAQSLQAAVLRHLGAQISSVADHLRDKPVDAMVDDVAVFARRNPLLFLGGAAVAGFAAARFLKSGSGTRNAHKADDDPWAGHLDSGERNQ